MSDTMDKTAYTIAELINKYNDLGRPSMSLEFFPPKTPEAISTIYQKFARMQTKDPAFIDVTWGAGGSSQDLTLSLVQFCTEVLQVPVCCHLTCTGQSRDQLEVVVKTAHDSGVTNFMALRGDKPAGAEKWVTVEGGLEHASDLVTMMRGMYHDKLGIACGCYPECHPESPSVESDIEFTKLKADVGANVLVTQLSFSSKSILKLRDTIRSWKMPVKYLAGVMIFPGYQCFKRTLTLSGITSDSTGMLERFEAAKDNPAEFRRVALEFAKNQIHELVAAGIDGVHVFTMNFDRSSACLCEEACFIPSYAFPQSCFKARSSEMQRVVFWNQNLPSYYARTRDWKNEHFTSDWSREMHVMLPPTFDIRCFGIHEGKQNEWGTPLESVESIKNIMEKFWTCVNLSTPWNLVGMRSECAHSKQFMMCLLSNGILPIEGQIPGSFASEDKQVGWGRSGRTITQLGYVVGFIPNTMIEGMIGKWESIGAQYAVVSSNLDVVSSADQSTVVVTKSVCEDGTVEHAPFVVVPFLFRDYAEECFGTIDSVWKPVYAADEASLRCLDQFKASYSVFYVCQTSEAGEFVDSESNSFVWCA